MEKKVTQLAFVGALTMALTPVPAAAQSASCQTNCANSRTADLAQCNTYTFDDVVKKCISTAHSRYARCVRSC